MEFYPFEVTVPHIIYACLGGFIVLFGMFSLFLRERLYISEACWAFLFGIIVGPYCADIFNPRAWTNHNEEAFNVITLEFTRVILAIGVFAIGVELPKAYMKRHWKSLFYLLVPVMTWGWLVSAAFIYALIPGLNFLTSLAVAACLTPTDPILAAAVIGGKWADKHVPAHIRHLLAAESGCNDGAAFPFLFLALYLLLDHPNTGHAIRDWFLLLWLYQVLMGAIIGAALGFGFRYLMKFCERMDLIDRHSYVAQYVSLAMFTIGVTTLLGSDDLLAAFACGTAFAWDGFFNKQIEQSVFSSVIDLLFNIAAFIYIGAWMPFDKFQEPDLTLTVWRLFVIAVLVLLFRRLPVMLALYRWIPDVKNFREAVFCGHFGPIGVGAVFISTLATEVIHRAHKTPENASNYHQIEMLAETIQPIVGFMVLCSITIHGLSIPSFSLGRRVHSVHRTWSRHATMTSTGAVMQPEWTIQATHVQRGDEKIVVNRDTVDLEKGELDDDEKTKEGSRRSAISDDMKESGQESSAATTSTVAGDRDRLDIRVEGRGPGDEYHPLQAPSPQEIRFMDQDGRRPLVGSTSIELQPPPKAYTNRRSVSDLPPSPAIESEGVRTPDGGDYREETYPDGGRKLRDEGEIISEWKEGSQTVIERRRAPGEDVEVIVIKDGESTGERIERQISNTARRAKEAIVASTPSLARRGSAGMRRSLSRSSSTKRHGHKADKGKQPERPPITIISPAPGDNDEAVEDEDEEGWSSDGSIRSVSKATPHTSHGNNKSPPKRMSSRVGSQVKNIVRTARKRGASFRKDHHHSGGAATGCCIASTWTWTRAWAWA
ncbi:hypothetical protein EST38_g1482 [Candolleomyces aberdarensis]|uniref:Cation/H+ exchanger transmembrane domain-containing protein n=1 Tax=Candolleomyces aberdarensis TaxID=2316362 RepID=A0A4Q2DUU6_9AGAR|nr:hypothetical protein EST38_g1482 [Candolleomyces aberdarensis]